MEIRASGEFEFADMRRACRALLLRRRWVWYGEMILGGLMAGSGALLKILVPGTFPDMLLLVVVGLLLGSMGWWVPQITAWMQWKSNRVLPGRHEFVFDEDGISREGQTSRVNLKWAGIHSWREDGQQFTLFPGPASALMIPKRFFSSPADVDSLRQMLVSHIGARK